MFGEFTLFKRFVGKVWRMNRSAKGLLITTTTLNGFSLAIHQICQALYPPNFLAMRYAAKSNN